LAGHCPSWHTKIIIEIKATDNSLTHALIIAIARVVNDTKFESYRKGQKIGPVVRDLLETTGIDLASGTGIPELAGLQENVPEYRILVYQFLVATT